MIPPAAAPPIRKRFGQHFLRDAAVIDAMIEAVSPRAGDVVVEIGPGDGALTFPLLAAGARVVAVEIDRARADALRRREAENLRVVEGDILRVDWPRPCRHGGRCALGRQSSLQHFRPVAVAFFCRAPRSSSTPI